MGNVTHVTNEKKECTNGVHRLEWLRVYLLDTDEGGMMIQNGSESFLVTNMR